MIQDFSPFLIREKVWRSLAIQFAESVRKSPTRSSAEDAWLRELDSLLEDERDERM